MKLPDEYLQMLQNHCDKLEVLEESLFEKWANDQDLKTAELWLQAQNQLRLSAIELMKSGKEKVRSGAQALAEAKRIARK